MARTLKLTSEVQQLNGYIITLGLTYEFVAAS